MGLELLAVAGAFALVTFLIVLTALVLSADEAMGEEKDEED